MAGVMSTWPSLTNEEFEQLKAEIFYSVKGTPNPSVTAMEAHIARLEKNQRTPGMIEKCPRCGGEFDGNWAFCPEYAENEGHDELCPVRAAKKDPPYAA